MIVGHDKPELNADLLMHYGIKGMRWGESKSTRSRTTFTKDELKATRKNYTNFASSSFDKKFKDGDTLFRRPISEADYKKLSNKEEIIRKGKVLYRTSPNKNETLDQAKYVSTSKKDADIYKAVLAKQGLRGFGGKSYKEQHEFTYKALETLRSPSEKARVDAFVGLIDTKSIQLKNGKMISGRELLRKNEAFKRDAKRLDAHRLGLEAYKSMLDTQWMDAPINTAYFKAVRDKGYNVIIDDNDRKHLSDQPLILLNPNGSVKRMKMAPVSADEINKIKLTLKPRV